MKKFFVICLLLALCLGLMPVHAAPRYPDQNGIVSDFANVISSESIDAIEAFNKTLKEKAGVSFLVATVHFLDGEDIKTYAKTLFSRWGLGSDDLLLLLAVGEDTFYTTAGLSADKKMPESSRDLLFSGDFRARFLKYDYDGALRVYVPELAQMLSKQYGVVLRLPAYFGNEQNATQAPAPRSTVKPNENFAGSAPFLNVQRKPESPMNRFTRSFGFDGGKLLILVIILLLVFSPRRRVSKWGKMAGCSTCGCGCAPLSWLFILLGLREAGKR